MGVAFPCGGGLVAMGDEAEGGGRKRTEQFA